MAPGEPNMHTDCPDPGRVQRCLATLRALFCSTFEKVKKCWRNDSLTLPATQCMMPNIVAKKIFKSAHHARRRIKNQFPVIFVASVINICDLTVWGFQILKTI